MATIRMWRAGPSGDIHRVGRAQPPGRPANWSSAKVDKAIAAAYYVPAWRAKLRSGNSQLIGLVVPNIANPHFAAVAREIENICLTAGYMTVVYSTGQDPERESQVLKMLRVQRVAGLVIIPTRSDAEHGSHLVDKIRVPTVMLDMFVEGLPYDVIKTDNIEAGRLAADHLLGLGHRRIGIVVGIAGLATSDDRLAGYLKAHAEHRGRTRFQRLAISTRQAYLRAIGFCSARPPDGSGRDIQRMTLGCRLRCASEGQVPASCRSSVPTSEFAAVIDPARPWWGRFAMARRSIELLLRQITSKEARRAMKSTSRICWSAIPLRAGIAILMLTGLRAGLTRSRSRATWQPPPVPRRRHPGGPGS